MKFMYSPPLSKVPECVGEFRFSPIRLSSPRKLTVAGNMETVRRLP